VFRFRTAPFALWLLASGCGGTEKSEPAAEGQTPPADGEGVASRDAEPAMGGYPEGPYGEGSPALGQTLENLELRGLWNLDTALPSASLTPEDVALQAFRDTGARYLLLVTAMGWCGSCQQAARELGQDLTGRVAELYQQGGMVAQLLLQGTGSSAPSDEETRAWAEASSLHVSVLGPGSERVPVVFPEREWGFIVRLDTMQVVWRTQVALYAEPRVGRQGVDELERRLAE
jgi:hypothetical protein